MRLPMLVGVALASVLAGSAAQAQARRPVIIDQDCRGPATTDLLSTLALVQSPDADVLGITVVSGDQWRDEEVAHTLRLLEIVGRTDIPVVPGAVFPLINRKEEIARWEKLHGRVGYQGAWNEKPPARYTGVWANRGYLGPFEMPEMPAGSREGILKGLYRFSTAANPNRIAAKTNAAVARKRRSSTSANVRLDASRMSVASRGTSDSTRTGMPGST